MSMGNYLWGRDVYSTEMATGERPTVGVAHPTVVPENFDPEGNYCPACGRPLSAHQDDPEQ
jgi:hypothetical protein